MTKNSFWIKPNSTPTLVFIFLSLIDKFDRFLLWWDVVLLSYRRQLSLQACVALNHMLRCNHTQHIPWSAATIGPVLGRSRKKSAQPYLSRRLTIWLNTWKYDMDQWQKTSVLENPSRHVMPRFETTFSRVLLHNLERHNLEDMQTRVTHPRETLPRGEVTKRHNPLGNVALQNQEWDTI